MNITALPSWDVTAIEIALDLEAPVPPVPVPLHFSGAAEPRICLVAGFAFTSQLKRIVGAVERAAPARAPSGIRLAPSPHRGAPQTQGFEVSIRPMRPLLTLQSKLIRAIEPGLASGGPVVALVMKRDINEYALRFIRDFIPDKTPPIFEPPRAAAFFTSLEIIVIGMTIYQLGSDGTPERIIAHWSFARAPR